ncbi:response regulator [Leptothoe kymatousa]|uniref:Response regulator n=1 Tax=Leptothoe kymatousa TAU-MAC 1615 TaxID=2364775 RepID=A0ABS5Y2H3_9CYAN|nr:response regulator [Leptothoe kymatousa]MBT9311996.1 response regulator [Leptothoe kymatousa TAU-MAC 1615]
MVTALVVEDSLTDREHLTTHLQNLKIMVVGVESSEEALFKIQALRPDVVFLDVVLPGQSGFELCRHLKSDQKTQDIPVVIYSTKDTDADRLWGSMLGADAYLSKPVDAEQLSQTIQKIIGGAL